MECESERPLLNILCIFQCEHIGILSGRLINYSEIGFAIKRRKWKA